MLSMLVLGNSHLTALAQAYALRCQQNSAPPRLEFVRFNDPRFAGALHAEALAAVLQEKLLAGPYDLYVSMVGGNDHSVLGMLNHPRLFDFVLPEAPGLALTPGAEILPAGLVMELLHKRIEPHVKMLAALRSALPGQRLVHVQSPPPVPSARHIATYPGVFADLIAERGVSPAALRYKLWRLHSSLYRQSCAGLGVGFLPVPAKMCDAEGMMVEQAWNHDPTHGNTVYGAHVLGQLVDYAA
jgi:hypothetical protein